MKTVGLRKRGSALLVTLGVLALLAIMGTTFVTLMRMDEQLTNSYVYDLRCELLARGLLEYCRGLLAEDLDRTQRILGDINGNYKVVYRYENRDTAGPGVVDYGFQNFMNGLNTDDNVLNTDEHMSWDDITHVTALRLGIPASNDFWLSEALGSYNSVSVYGNLSGWSHRQSSFAWDYADVRRMTAPRTIGDWTYDNNGIAYDVWMPLRADGVDDNQNGSVDDQNERDMWYRYYQNISFLTPGRPGPLLPGTQFTRESGLPGGRYWRAAIKIGLPEGQWGNINVMGNLEGDSTDPDYMMNNMDGRGLKATPAVRMYYCPNWRNHGGTSAGAEWRSRGPADCTICTDALRAATGDSYATVPLVPESPWFTHGPNHMDLITFQGYPNAGEEVFSPTGRANDVLIQTRIPDTDSDRNNDATSSEDAMRPYDSVGYSPLQLSLYFPLKHFVTNKYTMSSADADRWARAIIESRYGGNQRAAQGTVVEKRFRPGWQVDGASFYAIPSPEKPYGNDMYFGAEEALEHATPARMPGEGANPNASRLLNIAYQICNGDREKANWWTGRLRAHMSTLEADTILRGKIWPTEVHGLYRDVGIARQGNDPDLAVPASLRYPGAWQHISILKRVNLNILGAGGRDWDPSTPLDSPLRYIRPGDENIAINEQGRSLKDLKIRWMNKQHYEQDRCYYMLKGELMWYGWNETAASERACRLIACLTDMIDRDQDETRYVAPDNPGIGAWGMERFPVINEVGVQIQDTLKGFRVELYNPMENIPWKPDAEEAIDLANYFLRIKCEKASNKEKDYDLPTLDRCGADGDYNNPVPGHPKCDWMGMGGINGLAGNDRFLHIKLDDQVKADFTLDDLAKGIQIELYKRVRQPSGLVTNVLIDRAVRWVRSGDFENPTGWTADDLKLATYQDDDSGVFVPDPNQRIAWIGVYRRADPLNARTTDQYWPNPNDPAPPPNTEEISIFRCQGLNFTLVRYATFGKANIYPGLPGKTVSAQAYNYEPRWSRNVKVPDCDLPSVGWLGEAFSEKTYMDGAPLTEIHHKATGTWLWMYHDEGRCNNELDQRCKFNLCKPWGSARNLHMLDIFTVWDPSNDGLDNDNDGLVDEPDEVVVHGRIDINTCDGDELSWLIGGRARDTGNSAPASFMELSQEGATRTRGADGYVSGPRETIGDILRSDRFNREPGISFTGGSATGAWGSIEQADADTWRGFTTKDDDGDGVVNERDERDAAFTWAANYLTTRNSVFTAEIIAEVSNPPYYPGQLVHPSWLVRDTDVFARKHLLAILDRSRTLQVNPNGTCDFSGPVKVRALRWAQEQQ